MASDSAYRKKLSQLKEYHSFSFDNRHKLTPARKAAITRAWKRSGTFIEANKRAKRALGVPAYHHVKTNEKRGIKGVLGSKVITGKGAWVKVPLAPKGKKVSAKVENGSLVIRVGKQKRVHLLIDRKKMAENPDRELRKFFKKHPRAKYFTFSVNGKPVGQLWEAGKRIAGEMLKRYGKILFGKGEDESLIDGLIAIWSEEEPE